MSFDNTIAALINALNANTEATNALRAQMAQPHPNVGTGSVMGNAQMSQNHAATATGQVGSTPTQNLVPAAVGSGMPAAPTFGMPVQQQPVPAQQAAVAPFTTQQDLFTYTTQAYQAMGAEKGQRIMQILSGLGIQNLNDLKPEQYGTFYQHVEALKAGA